MLAKGIIIEITKNIDGCEIANHSYYRLCKLIADAVKTEPDAVFEHTDHQQITLMCDEDAFDIIATISNLSPCPKNEVFEEIFNRITHSVKNALSQLTSCDSIKIGSAKVEKVVSNRCISMPDGKIATRSSSCKDPKLIEAEEGLIDLYLRTLSFTSTQGKPMARLHYYATHPQSFIGTLVPIMISLTWHTKRWKSKRGYRISILQVVAEMLPQVNIMMAPLPHANSYVSDY